MKSELLETPSETPQMFPALYKSTANNTVVLFTSKSTGTAIVSSSKYVTIGDFSVAWLETTDTTDWMRLPAGSQVVLTQE